MTGISESEIEEQTLEWLSEIGWSILHGHDIDTNRPMKERDNIEQIVEVGTE